MTAGMRRLAAWVRVGLKALDRRWPFCPLGYAARELQVTIHSLELPEGTSPRVREGTFRRSRRGLNPARIREGSLVRLSPPSRRTAIPAKIMNRFKLRFDPER
jgi:hypothetical protein